MFQLINVSLDYGRIRDDVRTHFVATGTPVFSWGALSDAAGAKQAACRLNIAVDEMPLWDSGWIRQQTQQLRYAGLPLPLGVKISFVLQIRDESGIESAPYMDYLYRADIPWRAGWIGTSDETDERCDYFRRDFSVRTGLIRACLYACGIGYHKLYINGAEIDSAKMDPAFTDYSRQCQYVMFPDLNALLAPGDNCVGAIVAAGWRNNPATARLVKDRAVPFYGKRALTAMLHLQYFDGTEEWICTDESWQAGKGAYAFASVFDGVIYDAREVRTGWNEPNFKGDFSAAFPADGPGGFMEPMVLNPITEHTVRAPISVWPDGPNAVIMDFGQNLAGVARVRLPEKLTAGQRVQLTFTEELTESGRLFRDTLRSAKAEDTYIASGDARDLEIWQSEFTYHGFRYARIEGLGAGFDAMRNISAVELRTGLDLRSSFRCGDALVTKIHEACVETERGNMHSILTDCPQRDERMGWMNDATVRFEETPYNFEIGKMFPKLVRDLMDVQTAAGAISCTAPYVFGSIPADPVCSSFLMAGYESVMHLEDLDTIRKAYSSYAAWENCLLENSEDYIVKYSYYGDWAGPLYACEKNPGGAPGAVSAVTPGVFMSTGYSYLNCVMLAQFASWLEMSDGKVHYERLAENIKRAMLAKWYDAGSARMATGSQACQAFALWLGIIPDGDCQRAAKLLRDDLIERDYMFTTGNLCTRYMMDMLAKYGYIDEAWTLLTKQTYPSFGFMIQQEATTIWERFELMKDAGMNSHNHPMYGAVDYWMYAYLAGVRPTEPGWAHFEVRPHMPRNLLSTQAVIDTCKGEISVRWIRRYGSNHLQLSVPFGCMATVYFGGNEHKVGSGFHSFSAK